MPGNLARSNRYYSWATLKLLGRAGHCNVDRPALWVFPVFMSYGEPDFWHR